MIRPICRLGNPILREICKKLTKQEVLSDKFTQLKQDLFDSMKHYGGIGIAAPQIGVNAQVALIDLEASNRYGAEITLPKTYFINPQITVLSDSSEGNWEGCLSVPGMRGYVERPNHIKVTYYNEVFEEESFETHGFLAVVIQHELDHLYGKLYIDHIKDMSLLSFQEEFETFILPQK